ncbi:splicing factor U2af large subunit A isoform X3 [Prunus dulcis]|uniref:splicing factor U2af large subunit A isoform X3 n=1 Tax=Prunus dulcis TaxID=3755 RepID=UPI0014820FE4|nr:splicing factor U2af large subunit A isoform X3 [Prunus dulcis]
MSISSRLQEKNRKSSGISLHNDEESAARTRPFSCEEIMLRRNNKKLCDNAIDLGNIPRESIVENVSDRFESEGDYGHHKDLLPFVEKSVSEEAVKASSRKKETYNSKSAKTEVDFAKRKDRGGHESESLKDKPKKDTRTEAKGGKTEKQVHIRKKVDKRSIDNFPNESVKKHSRDSKGKERHGDLSRGNSERESKRKYQNGNEDKIRDRNAPKKHDPGKHHLVEVSERKERKESSKSRLEKSRLKRGRSRSRDREDRHGFRSVSPRAQKYTSHNLGMRSEIHVLKDRSERQHSDIDRSRVSSNGSSSHYRRHGVPENRLGGYSPRKRRTESAIKTPSPPDRSPEKKRARWDHPPTATDKVLSGSVASLFNSSNSNMSSNVHEMAIAVAVASATRKSISGASPNSLLSKKNVSIDSVQLTQATRPMRRLCVENVPSSTSENTLVESLNNFLLSSGVNHIQGTRPCISCSINKEKGQAVVEFLTPEDALAALSFDGSDFSGSILKIRRPKDFVEVSTGDPDKSMAVVETISDVVKDSPNKYVDQSVTLKACAGLNGMKLGGRVLTAVQAIHDASSLENSGNASLHEIPEYAKPLLKQPSQVLKLRNVLNLEHISLLSEPEVEEVLEDVRLECARFGTVKSVKVVKHCNNYVTTGVFEAVDDAESGGYQNILEFEQKGAKTDTLEEHIDNKFVEFPSNAKEVKEDEVTKGSCFSVTALDDEPTDDFMEEKSCKMGQFGDDIEIKGSENPSNRVPEQLHNQLNSTKDASKCFDVKATEAFEINDSSLENKLMAEEERSTQEEADGEKLRSFAGKDCSLETESDANEKIEIKEQNHGKEHDYDLGSIFEPGCVFVEFGRIEASLMAAHCLHGRVFEDRIVTVEYISLDHYRAHFKIEHV